jgi:hypothetical protein
MNKHAIDIASRRMLLLEKIRIQRMQVIEVSLQLQKPLAVVDAGIKAVHFIRRHPALMTSGAALLLAFRRRSLILMAQEGWRLLCLYPATAYLPQHSSCPRRDTKVD